MNDEGSEGEPGHRHLTTGQMGNHPILIWGSIGQQKHQTY